jgi:hypothetical protein
LENLYLVKRCGVDFDHVAVGIQDVDLRKARGGVRLKAHFVKIQVGGVLTVTFGLEECHRLPVTSDADGEMAVAGVNALFTAKGSAFVLDEMHLLAAAGGEPSPGEVEWRASNRLQAKDFAIEPAGALQVPNGNAHVVNGFDPHTYIMPVFPASDPVFSKSSKIFLAFLNVREARPS